MFGKCGDAPLMQYKRKLLETTTPIGRKMASAAAGNFRKLIKRLTALLAFGFWILLLMIAMTSGPTIWRPFLFEKESEFSLYMTPAVQNNGTTQNSSSSSPYINTTSAPLDATSRRSAPYPPNPQIPCSPIVCPKTKCPTKPEEMQVLYKRRLAETIMEVQQEISRLAGKVAPVDSKWSLKLKELAAELDPRLHVPESMDSWDYSARIPDMGPAPIWQNKTRHVCPEVFLGRKSHPFYQHGMEPENCTYVPSLKEVVTAILPAQEWSAETINFVITHIRKLYDIHIIVIIQKNVTLEKQDINLVSFRIGEDYKEAEVINNAVNLVTTPYIFFGDSLTHFSNMSSLERLVRILDELEHVKVVGGAARDLQGHWIHGCLQQRMADYQATYTMGYYYSKYECMYCDDLLAPFMTTIELLKNIPFASDLQGHAIYRHWFAMVRSAGHLTMVCPDVMFFITKHVSMSQNDWQMVAQKLVLEKVYSYDGQVYNFTCESVNISCKRPLNIVNSFLLPPCCRALITEELGYLLDYAEENNIEYELQTGSCLGAVKMGAYLPWDVDHDLVIERKDYKKWLSVGSYTKGKNCYVNVNKHYVYFTVYCKDFFLEFVVHDERTSRQFLPDEYKETPTSIFYGGRWTKVMANPGLYSRNKMGFDYLRHAAHWRTLKLGKMAKAKGGYDNPGVWKRCRHPTHHSCLDRYPGDGNLPFLRPFLHP